MGMDRARHEPDLARRRAFDLILRISNSPTSPLRSPSSKALRRPSILCSRSSRRRRLARINSLARSSNRNSVRRSGLKVEQDTSGLRFVTRKASEKPTADFASIFVRANGLPLLESTQVIDLVERDPLKSLVLRSPLTPLKPGFATGFATNAARLLTLRELDTRQESNLRALGSKPNGDAGNPRLVYWIRRQESDLRGLGSEPSWDTSNPHLRCLAGRLGIEPS